MEKVLSKNSHKKMSSSLNLKDKWKKKKTIKNFTSHLIYFKKAIDNLVSLQDKKEKKRRKIHQNDKISSRYLFNKVKLSRLVVFKFNFRSTMYVVFDER